MRWEDGVLYAKAVVRGDESVCTEIRLSCQRFLNQYENQEWEWEFDARYVEHVLGFASRLVHTKGPLAGQPIVLAPFQELLITAVYGFRKKGDRKKRMVTDVILFIPRKSGKSTLTAVIALMVVAILTVHRSVGYFIFLPNGGWEYCASIIAVCAALSLTGPGTWSVDNALSMEASFNHWALPAGIIAAVCHLALSWRPPTSGDAP